MAKVKLEIAQVLRAVASSLEESHDYQWGHMGKCNCGFLAQQVTGLNKTEIHSRAMQGKGDWNEQLNDYCPSSGLPMDLVISRLVCFGFDVDDLKHLERLSSPEILAALPEGKRYLRFNAKVDTIVYLNSWAAMIETRLAESVDIGELAEGMPELQLQPE